TQQLKEATDSDFLFLTPSGVIASTLNPRATSAIVADLSRRPADQRLSDGVIEYASSQTPLTDLAGRTVGSICVLRSFEDAQRRIARMKPNMFMLWLFAVATTFSLTYLLARRVVGPVEQLDRAATEVARQNYAIRVEVQSEDEIGRLAATFNNMCASI